MERKPTTQYDRITTVLPRTASTNFDTFIRAVEREFEELRAETAQLSKDKDVDQTRLARLHDVFGPFFTTKPVVFSDEQWRVWLKALMLNFLQGPTFDVIKDKFRLLTGIDPTIERLQELDVGWKMVDEDPLYTADTPYQFVDNPTISVSGHPTIKLMSEELKRQGYRITVHNPYGAPLPRRFMDWLVRAIKPAHVVVEMVWPELDGGFVAGNEGTYLSWSGGVFAAQNIGNADLLRAYVLVDEYTGFMLGERVIDGARVAVVYRWDGAAFSEDASIPAGEVLHAGWPAGDGTLIVVGEHARIMRWDSVNGWVSVPWTYSGSRPDLYAVGGFNSNDYFVGGTRAIVPIIGPKGPLWRLQYGQATVATDAPILDSVRSISMVHPKLGWACGGDRVWAWDGAGFSVGFPLGGASTDNYTAIKVFEGFAMVVGYDGTGKRRMLKREDAWSDVSDGGDGQLTGLSLISPAEGYACGAAGQLLVWNGAVWTEITKATPSDLHGMDLKRLVERYYI